MGYTTDFTGSFRVTPPLKPEHAAYLRKFNETRRMKRDEAKAVLLPDPVREAVGLPIGHEGAYFVGAADGGGPFGFLGQAHTGDILDYNEPPGTPSRDSDGDWSAAYTTWRRAREEAIAGGNAQPGLWCQWMPNDDGTEIQWDGGEKFYDYVEWLRYLVRHFLGPWGYTLDGEVRWQGEDSNDRGVISAASNEISTATLKSDADELRDIASQILAESPSLAERLEAIAARLDEE